MQFVPGGPIEQAIMKMQMAAASEGGGRRRLRCGAASVSVEMPIEAIAELKKQFRFDKPVPVRYVLWLNDLLHLRPREVVQVQRAGVGRDSIPFPGLDLFRADRLPPRLPGVHPARRLQGAPPRLALRLHHRARSCSSGTRFPGGRSAPSCSCSSAAAASGTWSRSAASARRTGRSSGSGRRSPTRSTTRSCRCSATWREASPRSPSS